ncbi:MAG: Hint domain-containing protein [Sandaracinus sp.]|nr:Hint domain-containing protein [Sandaracinus sp.]MCB9624623.1 Hint domain-containing protein [Sandaracinus sp.]
MTYSRISSWLGAAMLVSAIACGDDDVASDAGRVDGGAADGGVDGGGVDAGRDGGDAGSDAGHDGGGVDAGTDAGDVPCEPACGAARTCCGGACVNTANDGRHCGGCGMPCEGPGNYCTGGRCEAVPCTGTCAGTETCCGTMCCGAGQICCDPQGPIEAGPRCVDPDPATGVCPQGCAPLCMCNAPGTPIATPSGLVAIADLKVGDLVYSVHEGAVIAVPIAQTRTAEVPSDHRVVRLVLDDGTLLEISPTHPLVDGRTIGDLRLGDSIEGVGVVEATLVPYGGERTYDILPASDTGTYFVGDARIDSTIPR